MATDDKIKYRKEKFKGYKYILVQQYRVKLPLTPLYGIFDDLYKMSADGVLIIQPGYRWDGASGPTIDTKSTMRASLVHDVLYQMMRLGQLSVDNRDIADRILKQIMLEDSSNSLFNRIRSSYYYWGVHFFAAKFAKRINGSHT